MKDVDSGASIGQMQVLLWADRSVIRSDLAQEPAAHRHHALQLSIALDAVLLARFDGGPALALPNVLIGSGQSHRIRGRTIQLYFEPESFGGRVLRGLLGGRPWASVDPGTARAFAVALPMVDAAGTEAVHAASANLIEDLRGGPDLPRPPEDRIWRVLGLLRENLGFRIQLEELADACSLSPSRLRHLFREQIGVPIREYVVWLRSLAAMGELATNTPLTEAAHAVGFADHSALSRTHRSTWGQRPSQFLREVRFPQEISLRRASVEAWRQLASLPLSM